MSSPEDQDEPQELCILTRGDLREVTELRDLLLESEIDARVAAPPGGPPSLFYLVAHPKDREAALAILDAQWGHESEGGAPGAPTAAVDMDSEVATCPACGATFAPVEARCPDCDLSFG